MHYLMGILFAALAVYLVPFRLGEVLILGLLIGWALKGGDAARERPVPPGADPYAEAERRRLDQLLARKPEGDQAADPYAEAERRRLDRMSKDKE